jgi:hypothetical protein
MSLWVYGNSYNKQAYLDGFYYKPPKLNNLLFSPIGGGARARSPIACNFLFIVIFFM